MFRNMILTWMLAVTFVMGAAPALPAAPVLPAQTAATQVATTAPLAGAALAMAPIAAVQLTSVQMATVRGAGFFSWLKVFKAIITVIEAVAGLIKAIKEALRSSSQTTTSTVEGGETLQRTETERLNYASDADYQAGIVSGTSSEVTSSWQQTEVWYGGGGCDGGGLQPYADAGGGDFQAVQMMMVTPC
ncbi:MAG TPA: hypothetical protein VF263_04715 [Longimicrobiaceae bacterium]